MLHNYVRQYETTDLKTLDDMFPKCDDVHRTALWLLYGYIISSWEKLVDIRFKLLGLVPSVSILFIVGLSKATSQPIKLTANLEGLIFTIAIRLYDKRNTELYDDLIIRARKIESEIGIETGHFLGRLKNKKYWVQHDKALNLIYWTSIIGWLLFILYQLFFLIFCKI